MNNHADVTATGVGGASPSGGAHSRQVADPARKWTTARDLVAGALLAVSLCLPWNVVFGVGVPASSGWLFALVWVTVLLSVAALVLSHLPAAEGMRAALGARLRVLFNAPLLLVVCGFVVYTVVQTLRQAGSGAVSPGIGPGVLFALAGAVLGAQPALTWPPVEHPAWHAWTRRIAVAAMVLAVLSTLFNIYWRTEYMWAADSLGKSDTAVIVLTLLYAVVAVLAVGIGCRWIRRDSAASQLAVVTLGASSLAGSLVVWSLNAGREIDAFHGIAQSTSTAGVGYEGYLLWVLAAAVYGAASLSAVTSTASADRQVLGAAVRTVLTLIAFWCLASIVLRIADVAVASSLGLPHSWYDTAMLISFDAITAALTLWLRVTFAKPRVSARVLIAVSTALVGFAIGRVVIGVAMALRVFYVDGGPAYNPVYGNTLAQQITSTFDVVICWMAAGVLVAAVAVGPLAALLRARREPAAAAPAGPPPAATAVPTGAAPTAGEAPTIFRAAPPEPDPVPGSAADRIARVLADSTQRFGAGTTYTGEQRGGPEGNGRAQ
ncbi:hypothetical protein [Mycobacterium sp. shizuoka-1]|uniref:DUF7937 domain-containing protein n=1 Tax=Mycobacterium sp. shizuoka-1 TaxID=2039281 RepID=UPI000C065700|nr:hypothetical protein [Mycobacterium sp. shizuoka-1]GAY17826.1 hypothetical protein MSZK_45520 [Mycobacterium sp. shizuoka-1]